MEKCSTITKGKNKPTTRLFLQGTTSLIEKKMNDEKEEIIACFPLRKVEASDIEDLRTSGLPGFVLKLNGNYYYSKIKSSTRFIASNLLGKHKCAISEHECKHLSAAPDEYGGCEKVRNRSTHIERYDWIVSGYESFNTKQDSFVVVSCSHYEKYSPREPLPLKKRRSLILGLEEFI